jgi:hypothetical protein
MKEITVENYDQYVLVPNGEVQAVRFEKKWYALYYKEGKPYIKPNGEIIFVNFPKRG